MSTRSGRRKGLAAVGPGGRIVVFIIISLVAWVLISIAVNAAYVLLPSGSSSSGLQAGGIPNKLYFLLVLPVALLIAGLIVWPTEEDGESLYHVGHPTANLDMIAKRPRYYRGRTVIIPGVELSRAGGRRSFCHSVSGNAPLLVVLGVAQEFSHVDDSCVVVGRVLPVSRHRLKKWVISGWIEMGSNGLQCAAKYCLFVDLVADVSVPTSLGT